MTELLLIPLQMFLQLLQSLFLTGMCWGRRDDMRRRAANVAVELLLKVRLKVLRLVARLGWSMLLRFLQIVMLFRLRVSCVSSVDVNPNGCVQWSLVLRK